MKLQENEEYMFRILAENTTGVSSPLEAKNLVKIASPFCKYYLKFFACKHQKQ